MESPTTCFVFGLSTDTASDRTLQLELSNTFDLTQTALLPELTSYLQEVCPAPAQSAAGLLCHPGWIANSIR